MKPELSVVIATYNRAASLRACLEALLAQTPPAEAYEIIVVVDGSTDGSREMLARFAGRRNLQVDVVPNGGQAAALNRGAALAGGRTCLFFDDDLTAEPSLVAEHLRAQRQGGGVAALGHITCVPAVGTDGFARCLAGWLGEHYAELAAGRREPDFMDCFGGNLSVPRELFLSIGGFATDLPRYYDFELGYRLAQAGLGFVYLPGARAEEAFSKLFRQIAADAEQAGRASLLLYRRHPAMLPRLQLGAFSAPRLRVVLLRRLLLTLNLAPGRLATIGRLIGRGEQVRNWYSFIYDYCYWRGVRRAVADGDTWRRLTGGTLILMYHAFGQPAEPPGRFVVPGRRFARQMAWLRARGYRVLSLGELLRCRRTHELPPARSVVLTIDDGYADNRCVAWKILRRHRLPATIFLVSGCLGEANRWDGHGELAGRALLSREDIAELQASGVDFEAHTRTHRPLPGLPADELEAEVSGSKADLERLLGRPLHAFAYPYGARDTAAAASAEWAGFEAACGIEDGFSGPATPPFALRRTEVYGTDSLLRFALTLWLGELPRPRR